ncbi:MAG: hypothetical protein AB1586_19945 [Pseudomonadota bacterium]
MSCSASSVLVLRGGLRGSAIEARERSQHLRDLAQLIALRSRFEAAGPTKRFSGPQ